MTTIATQNTEALKEIQQMALGFHHALREELHDACPEWGGCLFLGKYYAESDRIYFGLNPGTGGLEGPQQFSVELETNRNPPFWASDEDNREFSYWRNWGKFLRAHPDLDKWFNDRVTSAMLIPWRTPDGPTLDKLAKSTEGRVYEYSKQLVMKMLDHHQARLVLVAGKVTLERLNEFLGTPWDASHMSKARQGPGRTYQWRRTAFERVTVLQVPHFSRAVSLDRLGEFAEWLRQELRPFGLEPAAKPMGNA